MWMMPLHLHINQKSGYADDDQQMTLAGKEYKSIVQLIKKSNVYLKKI